MSPHYGHFPCLISKYWCRVYQNSLSKSRTYQRRGVNVVASLHPGPGGEVHPPPFGRHELATPVLGLVIGRQGGGQLVLVRLVLGDELET